MLPSIENVERTSTTVGSQNQMNSDVIKHKTLSGRYLKRDNHTGSVSEIQVLPPNQLPRKKASYIKHDNSFIGVFASEHGPVLFIDEKVFLFADESWAVELIKGNDKNQFKLLQQGQMIYDAIYQPPQPDDLDPWSDAESVDLFAWIAAKRHDKEIFQMWTLK